MVHTRFAPELMEAEIFCVTQQEIEVIVLAEQRERK